MRVLEGGFFRSVVCSSCICISCLAFGDGCDSGRYYSLGFESLEVRRCFWWVFWLCGIRDLRLVAWLSTICFWVSPVLVRSGKFFLFAYEMTELPVVISQLWRSGVFTIVAIGSRALDVYRAILLVVVLLRLVYHLY